MNFEKSVNFPEGKYRRTLLIITEDSPMSYSPAGERVRHIALAGNSFLEKVIVFSLQSMKKTNQQSQHGHVPNSGVWLHTVNFKRIVPYPFYALLDPIKFLVFFVHGSILSKRFKPLFVMASMPPFDVGLCAWLLTKHNTHKLVIDLRDDWESAVSTQLKRYFPRVVLSALSAITYKIYSNAFMVFAATQTIASSVEKRDIATKIALVPNGADTSIFLPKSEGERSKIRMKYKLPLNKFVAVYCGSGKTTYYRLDRLLSSVKLLSQEVKDRICIVFYVYDGFEKLQRMKKELGIFDDVLEIRAPLSRKNLAEVMAACDVGLVPFDDAHYLLCARSTKLYEYLSAGLYVISSGPKGGELEALFSENPAFGLFVNPSAKDFADSLDQVSAKEENLFNSNARKMRHSFVERHYDRKIVIQRAMKDLLERFDALSIE